MTGEKESGFTVLELERLADCVTFRIAAVERAGRAANAKGDKEVAAAYGESVNKLRVLFDRVNVIKGVTK